MKLRIDMLKSVDVENIPDNFWDLGDDEQQRIMIEAIDGTVVNASDFINDDNGDYTATIADYWEHKQ